MGIPWRVAFALQADGWYLRQDIIWAKSAPMPESVFDRCTKSHEYIFLLMKNDRYFYDYVAIMDAKGYYGGKWGDNPDNPKEASFREIRETRNKRSVWTVSPEPCISTHFATFPPALIEPCVLAGTSARGCCSACGAPWRRVVERKAMIIRRSSRVHPLGRTRSAGVILEPNSVRTMGWEPTCSCSSEVVPAVVLDPFGGAGTTGLVAQRYGRAAVLIDLNPEYAVVARDRIKREYSRGNFLRDRDLDPAPRHVQGSML